MLINKLDIENVQSLSTALSSVINKDKLYISMDEIRKFVRKECGIKINYFSKNKKN